MYILTDIKNSTFFFLCVAYKVTNFDQFCNIFVVETANENLVLIPFQRLENKNSIERVYCNNAMFIKAETLDLRAEDYL